MNDLVRIPVQSFPEDTPIDPYGKKKGYRSWQETIRRVASMRADELVKVYGDAIQNLSQYGDITLRELAIIKAFEEMILHPNPSMLNLIMERDEGRVPQAIMSASGNIGDWMQYAKEQNIEIDDVMEEAKKIMAEYNAPPKVVEGEIVE